ncbi:MAG: FHA domain-containing serine/threonine-protein kinase [Lachnospiraceae bacterium]|nr:FHA domain-containing serine/threonine-protein kinase [Lachnospiraceae bacterium]
MSDTQVQNRFTLPVTTILKKRYQITKVIGIGGFGITYKVRDTYTDKVYAMKEYAPSSLCTRAADGLQLKPLSQDKVTALEHGRVRFLEEADMLRQLDSIAGIVPVMDCFNENHTSYFVMQFVEGVSLKEHLQAHDGRLGIGETLSIIGGVAYALNRVHEKKGICHRDLSPDNIFVTKNNEVRVIDFGNAKNMLSQDGQTSSIALKPGFAPPEQYSSKGNQGSYTDVYALAGTMYYCLTGMMIPAAPERMNGEEYIPLREIFPELTQSFSNAVDHALKLDYKERTQNMGQFMAELKLDTTLYEDKVMISPYVEMVKGVNVGRRWNILKDTCITVGRSKKSDIAFPNDLYISKRHCEVYYDSEKDLFYIEDYSTNGTYVEGSRIAQGALHKMMPGQTFAIGDKNTVMKVGVMHV